MKENLIIEAFQTTQFHVINRARSMRDLATKWGLDNDDQVNLNDPNRNIHDHFTSTQADRVLETNYFPARIIDAIKERFDAEGDNSVVNSYFQNCRNLPSRWDRDFYEVDRSADPRGTTRGRMVLTYQAVAWILKNEGFLI